MKIFKKDMPYEIIVQICDIQKEILHENTDIDQMKSLIRNGAVFFVKVGENQKVLSFCSAKQVDFDLEIYDLATIPSERRHGLATIVLKEILKYAHQKSISSIYLEVRESNDVAIDLYKKFGFEKYSVRRNYYADNGESAVCMVKRFNPSNNPTMFYQ